MRELRTILRPVAKEFESSKCCFDYSIPDDFVKSQWQSRTKSTWYLAYRWFVAIFFTAVVVQSMVDQGDAFYFIYMTNWGVMMCMATNVLGAVLVSAWHFHPEYANRLLGQTSLTSPFKVYWMMHITTLVLSIVITIVYWSILYTAEIGLSATNVLTHAFNAIFMFLDLLIVAYPVRLLHVFLPLGFGVVYVVFSVTYYLLGGVDGKGNHYVYNVLNWESPEKAAITVVGVLFLTCFVYVVVFAVYKLRSFVYRRLRDASLILPTSSATEKDSAGHSAGILGVYSLILKEEY